MESDNLNKSLNQTNEHEAETELKIEDYNRKEVDIDSDETKQEKIKLQNQLKLIEDELTIGLEKVLVCKKEGNDLFKKQIITEAIKYYSQGAELCEESLSNYSQPSTPSENITSLLKNLQEERVNLLSNISMCYLKQEKYQDTFNIDMSIIRQYNPNWDKSYNRLIIACLRQGDLAMANQYCSIFRMIFNEGILSKYQSTFNDLEEENRKQMEKMKSQAKKPEDTTVQSSIVKEVDSITVDSKKNKKSLIKKRTFNFKWFLGGLVLFSSTFALFYLINNKKRFFN